MDRQSINLLKVTISNFEDSNFFLFASDKFILKKREHKTAN